MSEMDEKVLDEAMESSTEENASETKEDENVTSTEETAETAENADAEASEADSEDPDKKKSFFKKKKDKKDEQIEELTDKVKRQMAEFDNFRKRTEKEKSQMYDMGAKTIVEKILPVIDNFERGLAAVPEDNKEDAFVVGMDKIYRQMLTVLEEAGVKPIEAVGAEFDPNFHNAVRRECSSRRTPEGIYVQRYCGKTQYGKSSKLIIP